ncbi:MAG: ADP-ribosylation factor-like protein [Promethearchaeota archaeon]
MVLRFSVVTLGGNEVAKFESDDYRENRLEMNDDLFSGFMEALQMLSEEMGKPVRQVQLSNLMLYVKTYGDFTVRLLVDEKHDDDTIERVFRDISRETLDLLSGYAKGEVVPGEVVRARYLPLLAPVLGSTRGATESDSALRHQVRETSQGRLAMVGLAGAGKTTIKRVFFGGLPPDEACLTRPTIGVEVTREVVEFLEGKFQVIDVGGQTQFVKANLEQSDAWRNLTTLVFVVDVQDPEKFEEAKMYLDEVWRVVERQNPRSRPTLSIFFHKHDVTKREQLAENLWTAFLAFEDVSGFASFHVTTIEDSSAVDALVKTLYFSTPDLVIKKLLEEGFLEHVQRDLMPHLARLLPSGLDGDLPSELASEVYQGGVTFGKTYGLSLQRSWLESLTGKYAPLPGKLGGRLLDVTRRGPTLLVKVPNFKDEYPVDFTKTLFDGVLAGITKTFFLVNPKIVDEDDNAITWQVGIEEPL